MEQFYNFTTATYNFFSKNIFNSQNQTSLGRLMRMPFQIFAISVAKHQKNLRRLFEVNNNFSKKVSQFQKTEGGTLCDFSTSILSRPNLSQKMKGVFGEKKFKKVSQCRRKTGRGPFSLPQCCMLRWRKETTLPVRAKWSNFTSEVS